MMNFDKNSHQTAKTPKKSGHRFLLKIIGAGILIFFLLFMMNKIVKKEVSTLVEQKNILSSQKSLETNSNH